LTQTGNTKGGGKCKNGKNVVSTWPYMLIRL
jgi:hypothetical protein